MIPEESVNGYLEGYAENYLRLYLKEKEVVGDIVKVKVVAPYLDGALVELDN